MIQCWGTAALAFAKIRSTACILRFLSGVFPLYPEGSRVDRHQTFKALIVRNRWVVVGEGGVVALLCAMASPMYVDLAPTMADAGFHRS